MGLNIYNHDSRGRFTSNGKANTIEVVGVDQAMSKLAELRTDNPDMDRQIRKIIAYVIRGVKKNMIFSAGREMDSDPRKAARAVKSMVYRRIFGANVNILSRRRRSNFAASIPQQKLHTGRGGNRMKRSAKTIRMMSYWGEDRGFVLRWLANSTADRYNDSGANRGRIVGNGWFRQSSIEQMNDASEQIRNLIDEAITKIWEK